MDAYTFWLIIIGILAVLIIVGFIRFRGSARAKVQLGPASMEYQGSATPPAPPAALPTPAPAPAQPEPSDVEVEVTNVKSHAGGAYVSDEAGGRVRVENVETKDDVIVSRSQTGDSPKA